MIEGVTIELTLSNPPTQSELAQLYARIEQFVRAQLLPEHVAYAASKSDYLENKDLEHNLGKTAFTMPTVVYIALCTVTPTDASTGATITEASYTGYARKQLLGTDLGAAGSGSITTVNQLQFAPCTAGSSTIIGFALCDNASIGAGNILYWGSVASKVIDTSNTPATIAVGGLTATED